MKKLIAVLFLLVSLSYLPVLAQEEEPADAPAAQQEQFDDKELRLALAKKMHEIRPTRLQVEAAINELAWRTVPEAEREAFKKRVIAAINFKKLEENSINAMVEVFTLSELEQMVAYHLTPEAQSISRKMPLYQGIIQPEIMKMLDNAMLEMRTGNVAR